MRVTLLLAAAALAACSKKEPEIAPAPAVPATPVTRPDTTGGLVGQVVTERAKVIAVDTVARRVTLVDETNDTTTVAVGPEVTRLGSVRPGDYVVARYVEAFALDIRKSGTGVAKMEQRDTVMRIPGPKPGAMAAQRITATVEVAAIDAASSQVTIRTARGATIPLDVRDPRRLQGLKVGDRVDVTYIEAFGLTVESP